MSSHNWSHLICTLLLLSLKNSAVNSSNNIESVSKSTVTIQQQHSRDEDFERYNSENVFVCYATSASKLHEFLLVCDRALKCKLLLSMFNQPEKITEDVPGLDELSDNCTEVYNNFERGEVANQTRFPLTNGKYIVPQNKIVRLEFVALNITHVPPDYFCQLTSVTHLGLQHNTMQDTRNFSFAEQCSSHHPTSCCACNLNHLNLQRNGLQVVGSGSFCRFPNLETLDLSSNEISEISDTAFVALTKLQKLDISQNQLKFLPIDVLHPLTNLVHLDLFGNQFADDVFHALQHVPKPQVRNLTADKMTKVGNDTIGYGPSSLIELCLRYNRLTSLQAELHSFRELQLLDVVYNNIVNISDTFFDPLEQLVEINLSSNRLPSLPDDILSENGHVHTLRVAENQLQSIPKINSSSLETLILSSNLISAITLTDKENLCQLVNLKYLNLADNHIQTIVPHAFDCNASSLTRVILRNNNIKSIMHIFDEASIHFLDLSANKLSSFSFDDFADDLLELDLSENQISEFPCDSKILHRSMSLKTLFLSDNSLRKLTDVTLPPNLKHLGLSNNAIRHFFFAKLPMGNADAIPSSLRVVDLRSNWFEVACPLVFYALNEAFKVRFLMGRNPLLCPCEEKLFKKYDHRFSGMVISQYSQSCFADLEEGDVNATLVPTHQLRRKQLFSCESTSDLICQCNLHRSYSAECNLPCPESCTCHIDGNFTTYSMNCSELNFRHVPQLSIRPKLALILDFSVNDLKMVNSSSFSSYTFTSELYLKNNKLTKIVHDAFRNLTHLQILNLEENWLEELPSNLFTGLTKLTELYLAKNRLTYVPHDVFLPLISLRTLQLQSNFLTNFSVWRLEELETLSSLRLGNNTWSCDCSYVEHFRDWLQNFSYLVNDASDLFCTMESESVVKVPLLSFNSSYCYASPQVIVMASTIHIWTSIVTVVLLLTIVTIMVFVYRHKIQVLLYSNCKLK